MGYYFECTYCNEVTPVDEFEGDIGVNCTNCGEDLCQSCASHYKDDLVCDQCFDELSEQAENDDWAV